MTDEKDRMKTWTDDSRCKGDKTKSDDRYKGDQKDEHWTYNSIKNEWSATINKHDVIFKDSDLDKFLDERDRETRAETIKAVLKVVDRKIDELNKQITEIIHEEHIGFKEQKIDWRTRNIELYENLKDELRKEICKI
jgi:GTPase Era involved in 16S rRNA processing